MNSLKPEIYLADLIRAFIALRPDNSTAKNMANLLGFSFPVDNNDPKKEISQDDERVPTYQKWKYKSRQPKFSDIAINDLLVDVLIENIPVHMPIPDLPEPLIEYSEENELLLSFFPLFFPLWTRGNLSKLLSVDEITDFPDIEILTEMISENLPIEQIPYEKAPSLHKGVQVLIDKGPGLEPFLRDQDYLLQEIKNIVGHDQVDVWEFIGTPLQYAVSLQNPESETYEPPVPGTPILLLSDLGIASPPFSTQVATQNEWEHFIEFTKLAECPLLGLVPYLPNRWPDTLKKQASIIQWDHTTSVITIMQSLH